MKIIIYSDLHLEFGNNFKPPKDSEADLMILAGDIIIFNDFVPLKKFLVDWNKPVLYIAGNHEYYTKKSMLEGEEKFFEFIRNEQPNIAWLYNLPFTFKDVEFFGGTMWTNFAHSPFAMITARQKMNDFHLIKKSSTRKLIPEDTVKMHNEFKEELIVWLEENKNKKRVVISHHAPCLNPNSNFKQSKLQAAYNSLDMVDIIEKYQPDLWVYGHTHEADDQMIGETRIISNPFGYYKYDEVNEFDKNGKMIEL